MLVAVGIGSVVEFWPAMKSIVPNEGGSDKYGLLCKDGLEEDAQGASCGYGDVLFKGDMKTR